MKFANKAEAEFYESSMLTIMSYDPNNVDYDNILNIIRRFPDSKDLALLAVARHSMYIKNFSAAIMDDDEVILTASASGCFDWKLLPVRYRDNKKYVMSIAHNIPILNLSKKMRNDVEVVMSALSRHQSWRDFTCINTKILRSDKVVMAMMISNASDAIGVVDAARALDSSVPEITYDMAMAAVSKCGECIDKLLTARVLLETGTTNACGSKYVLQIADDFKIMKAAVFTSFALQVASSRLKNNEEIVRRSIDGDRSSIKYAGSEICNDVLFMGRFIQKYPYYVEYAGVKIRSCATIMMDVFLNDNELIKYTDSTLLNDVSFMRQVIRINSASIKFAGATVLADVDIVRPVVFSNIQLVKYLRASDRRNPKILYIVLHKNPRALFIIPTALRPRGYSAASVLVCLRLMCGF